MKRLAFVLFVACFTLGVAAQEPAKAPAPPQAPPAQHKTQQVPVNPDDAVAQDLTKASEEAVHGEEGEVHEEHAEFKYSPMVAKLGHFVGLGPRGMYWLSMAINFAFLGIFFWMLLKSKLPQMFRGRTATIQKALKEAQAASAEASRRLSDIETRLSKMDSEVSEIRAGAERDAAAEEERVRLAAEQDKQKVVAAAETEIAAIARSARHDLKSFAASLAVDIASHRIKVDDRTDQGLVREFVTRLGKDGE
jgi:F-type H+-transporting ATPase subunit b